ncbi:TetR/AcrR family transcriptional regulator [Starkeya sp. 3C]|uniref:TetR/AcrR family transcriptional regulator n=1 Tax=Ancylobacter moscoviensis TaxID=2597768 RepID=A0ABY3DLQ9_9HYPH|nr:TetR/AcrR family transcriptional regulator [Ancylobacter moscoviensis]TSJ60184.1 TetR/AcrR family transcriptional regulator [Ancylobacter moscoviensis]
MSKPAIPSQAPERTRERILKAAIIRFSTHSYEATGLRDLAADVGVDVAYVHRCFGSKEKLFREALKASMKPERLFAEDGDIAAILSREMMRERGADEIGSLDIAIRSFSSPEAARVLRDTLMEDFVTPLTERQQGLSEMRATLIAAVLGGVGILKDVIAAGPLRESRPEQIEAALAQIIQEILVSEDDDGALQHRPHPPKGTQ